MQDKELITMYKKIVLDTAIFCLSEYSRGNPSFVINTADLYINCSLAGKASFIKLMEYTKTARFYADAEVKLKEAFVDAASGAGLESAIAIILPLAYD